MRTSQHVVWLHHGSGVLLATAAGSRCATSETEEACVGVLSRVLDLCETAVAAETEGHSSKQHRETEQESTIKNQQQWSKQTDETGTSRLTDRDAAATSSFDPAASLGHGRSNKSPSSRTGVSRHGKNCSKVCSTSRRR